MSGILLCLALFSEVEGNCPAQTSELRCNRLRRCYWGDMGCVAQKHLRREGSSILNNFVKTK